MVLLQFYRGQAVPSLKIDVPEKYLSRRQYARGVCMYHELG